jgi:serine/threonine protein kinase/tetratricopeptide (TPR) repeat protein
MIAEIRREHSGLVGRPAACQDSASRESPPARSKINEKEPLDSTPKLIDRTCRIHAKLGEGGMGAVYSATHRVTGRRLAVKLLRAHRGNRSAGSTQVEPRLALAREFRTLASLHHPNVIEVTDYGFDNESGPYLAMELLEPALTLTDAGNGEPFSAKIKLLAQLLRALAYLHRRGVIHRDLKPTNVLCSGGTLKLVDFGLAVTSRLEGERLAGTLQYFAPELWHGSPPSVRSDLYAVGVIIRQLMAAEVADRRHRFAEEFSTVEIGASDVIGGALPELAAARMGPTEWTPHTPLAATLEGIPPVPAALLPIMRRLLAPDPEDRYASATDVLHDLNRATGFTFPVETTVTRESFLQAPQLVGRDEELNRLSAALEAAGKGSGSTWLVTGESGAGKSRMLSELRTLALVQGASVTLGQAVAEGGRSFHLWAPALRTLCLRVELSDAEASVLKPLVPELPTLMSRTIPDAAPLRPKDALTRLFKALAGLLQMQDRTTVILLEDLQWADVDSLDLLSHLSALAPQMRLLIVGSYRSQEAPALAGSLPDATQLKLRPLGRQDCARLTASMSESLGMEPEVVEYLYRQSEGNVFFLIEIVRELANRAGRLDLIGKFPVSGDLLTGGIAQVVRRRIQQISREDRALLTLAATAGREVDFVVLRALAPEVDLDKWLLRAFDAGILERQAEQWRFAHDKLRDAILADIPSEESSRAHGSVARAIESVYAGPGREAKSAILAYHSERAGEMEKALTYFLEAGDFATRLCAYGESRKHYAAALRAAGALPMTNANRRNQVDTLLKQAYTCFVSDSAEENFSRMTKARALLDAIGPEAGWGSEDKLRLARIESAIGRIHFYRGDMTEAIRHYRGVLTIADASGDRELAALPACLIGTAFLAHGQALKAEPLLSQAVAPLERLGEPFESFRAAGYHGASLIATGKYAAGIARLDGVLARAKEIGQPNILSAAYLMRGSAYLLSGDWPLVIENLTEVVELANETGDRLHLSLAWSGIGWARSHLGSVDGAKSCRKKGVEIAEALGGQLMLADWYQAGDAEMALHAGEFDFALHLGEALAGNSRAAGRLFSCGIAERVLGEVLAHYARYDEADGHMRNSIAALEEGGLVLQAGWSRARWAVQLRTRGGYDEAQELFREAQGQFERAGCFFPLSELRRLQTQYI